jgi:SAM-dependent methyltransferase
MAIRGGPNGGYAWPAAPFSCPICHTRLTPGPDELYCRACERPYAVVDGLPHLVVEEALDDEVWEAVDAWDELSERYGELVELLGPARFVPIDRPLVAIARGDVLEVGCGDGRLLAQVDRRRVRSLIGIDLSPRMALRARQRGFEVAVGQAERLPLPDCSFDAVLSGFYSLRYAELDRAVAEVGRVLRPGGRFGLTLQGRRAVALASRLRGIGLLPWPGKAGLGLRLLLGRERGAVLPTDVADLASLAGRFRAVGLAVESLLGTAYLPGLTGPLGRLTGGRLPYLRDGAAARFGRDLIVLGRRI